MSNRDSVQGSGVKYRLTLFVTGATVRSARAIANVRHFCETDLVDAYELEMVDLYQTPERARADQVVAVPTLVRHDPMPPRRVIGDMANRRQLNDVVKAP